MPGYLTPLTDPAFGTRVSRVSDGLAMGVDLTGGEKFRYLRNAYSKKQAWNSDGSLLLLQMTSPAPLLDGRSYRFLRMVTPPGDATWSNTQPDRIFGIRPSAGDFISQDVTTGARRVEAHFDGYANLRLGDGEGNLSDDDRWAALHGTTATGEHDVILLDRSTGVSRSRRLNAEPNWIGMSHSGAYVVVSYNKVGTDADHGTVVFDRRLNFLRNIDRGVSHADVVYDTTGREVYVAGNDCTIDAPPAARCSVPAVVSAFPLDGSRSYPVIARSAGYNPHGEHISGRALARRGWAVISDSGAPGPALTYPGRDQVFAVQVNPADDATRPVAQPFAMVHHVRGTVYQAWAMASVDPTGSRVVWGSEWAAGPLAPVYAYVAEQPAVARPGPRRPVARFE
jgi:hypothetical protein